VAGWLAGIEVIIRLTQSSWAGAGTELGNNKESDVNMMATDHLEEGELNDSDMEKTGQEAEGLENSIQGKSKRTVTIIKKKGIDTTS
jgi:hypothetical protein